MKTKMVFFVVCSICFLITTSAIAGGIRNTNKFTADFFTEKKNHALLSSHIMYDEKDKSGEKTIHQYQLLSCGISILPDEQKTWKITNIILRTQIDSDETVDHVIIRLSEMVTKLTGNPPSSNITRWWEDRQNRTVSYLLISD